MGENLSQPQFLIEDEEKVIQDRCGLVMMYSKEPKHLLPAAIIVAGGVQHRGQQGAGVAIHTGCDIRIYTDDGLFNEALSEKVIEKEKLNVPTNFVLIHGRYGTDGGYEDGNLQPCHEITPERERVVVIHNGQFAAVDEIRNQLAEEVSPTASDTVLFTKLLAQTSGRNHDEKVLNALNKVKGAYSLMIAIGEDIYLTRDGKGIKPMVIGESKGTIIAASETIALDKIGATITGEVEHGEVVRVNKNGVQTIRYGIEGSGNFCDFEYNYIERPDSRIPAPEQRGKNIPVSEWPSILSFRERCGVIIAQENPISNATFVTGLPDSGVAVGTGYAIGAGIPYRQAILRDHYDQNGALRLFQTDHDMEAIESKVLGKLSMIRDPAIWKDAVVVFGDDSIVRSKVSKKVTQRARELGAKEVHWIIGFGPVAHPCHLGVSMRSHRELIAHQYNSDPRRIADAIGADSIYYISYEGFVKAKSLNGEIIVPADRDDIFLANGGCGGCITGRFPINIDGSEYIPPIEFGSRK